MSDEAEAKDSPSRTLTVDPSPRSDDPASDSAGLPVVDPDRYEVIRELARGGLGRVLEVLDKRLGRQVAIKQLIANGPAARARFEREALLTARLEHPAIVPVHDAGRWPSGEPFYAMKLVSGLPLSSVIARARTLDARLALLPHVIAVADAVAYAHSHQLIHRDLKPANVIVGNFGETVVLDWGLAKDLYGADDEDGAGTPGPLAGDDGLTGAGAVMGTPRYMPPEQARGLAVDERADVYAIGAILHEVLAGEPPYHQKGGSEENVLVRVLAGPPAPIEILHPGIPPDLAAIVRKAMHREPDGRYPSARQLADDLRRFQTGRLVSAHHYSSWTLARRWLARRRGAVAIAALALVALTATAIVSVRRIIAERNVAAVERNAAQRRADQLLLAQSRGALERDPTEALAWLRTYPVGGEGWGEVRDVAIDAQSRGVALHVLPRDGFFTFTWDGRGWLGWRRGSGIELRDVESGALLHRLPYEGHLYDIAACPDGHTIAVLGWNSDTVSLMDLEGAPTRLLRSSAGVIEVIKVSPDGRWLAMAGKANGGRLWPLGGGEPRDLHVPAPVKALAFSADGRRLLIWSTALYLCAVDDGACRSLAASEGVESVALSPDGAGVAIAGQDGTVSLWSAATARWRVVGAYRERATRLDFSPDGQRLASAGADGIVQLWSPGTGERRTLTGHRSAIANLAFSPDGRSLVSAGRDGELRLWWLESGEGAVLGRTPGRIVSAFFSPDGRHLASVQDDQAVRLWRALAEPARSLQGHARAIHHVSVSPDGRLLASASADGTARIWAVARGDSAVLPGRDKVLRVAFSPDGATLATVGDDRDVRIWDVSGCGREAPSTCKPTARVLEGHRDAVWAVAFSPDGRTLATGGRDETVRLWEVATGGMRELRGHAGLVRALAFSPEGRHLASAADDGTLWQWDVASGAGSALGRHADRIFSVAYSHQGTLIATASQDSTVRLWDAATGAARVLTGHEGWARTVAFAPDDRLLASGGEDGTVRLWEVSTGASRVLEGHRSLVTGLVFSPDGALLASASRDRTVRLWDVRQHAVVRILQHEAEVFTLAMSPDGRWLASAGADLVVRLWLVEPHAEVPIEPMALRAWMAARSSAVLDARKHVMSP